MTKQYSDTVRNGWLDWLETCLGTSPKARIYTGSQPASVAASATGTLLWEGVAAGDWMAAASAGSKSITVPFTGTTSGSGTAGYYRILTSGGTAHEQGSVSRAFALTTTAITSSGGNVLTFADASSVSDGMTVDAAGVPAGTTVLSHTSTTVTLSAVTTGVSSGADVYFGDVAGDLWLPNTSIAPGIVLDIDVLTRTAPGA